MKIFSKIFSSKGKEEHFNKNWEICSSCRGDVTSYAAFIRGNMKKCNRCVKYRKDKETIRKFEKYYREFEGGA